MWFRNNKKYFSVEEKIKYYDNLKNIGTKEQKQKALTRLKELNSYKSKNKLGNVFFSKDINFNKNEKKKNKSRRVVFIGDKNDKALVIPVKKFNSIVPLKNFDKQRFLYKKDIKELSYNDIYEKHDFKNDFDISKDYLTNLEIKMLKNKFNL